jgi:hypothetical protein
VWADAWTGASAKRAARRANPGSPSRPRGAATSFWAGWLQDRRQSARRRWSEGWTGLDEKRRERASRPRPGQVTVPGTVIPNAQDEDGPEPRIVPDGDGGTDLRFGDDPHDPTGVSSCPKCHGTVLVDGEICLSCRDRQEQRNQHHDQEGPALDCRNCKVGDASYSHTFDDYCIYPDLNPTAGMTISEADEWDREQSGPDSDRTSNPTTTEGTTDMTTTIPTGEVTSLSQTIRFCEDSAQAYRAQVHAIEQTQATLSAEEVSGPAADAFAAAMEQSHSAAASMEVAAEEFKKHLVVQEAYDAVQGAGTKRFITAGR